MNYLLLTLALVATVSAQSPNPAPAWNAKPVRVYSGSDIIPPHSPTPIPVLTVSGAAGAKAIS